MYEYIFLYAIAFVWIVFAVVQDLRTREIANWLSFSLIVFVLAYRAFYAVFTKDVMFFVYGVIGVVVFVGLGYVFFYGRVFGGGDAKLLMGLGGIWPYSHLWDYFYIGGGFVMLLFTAGAIYTLFYTLFLVGKNKVNFVREFKKIAKKDRKLLFLGAGLFVVFEALVWFVVGGGYFSILPLFLILIPLLYYYTKAVEKTCMIKLKNVSELTEGDWLEKGVRVGKTVVHKSVYGLSSEEIRILKKGKKKVWIKDGVPFTPSFLIGFLVTIYLLKYFS